MTRILLVDDSEDSRLLMQVLLKKLGCQVDTAVNGQEAIERIESGTFDLVLMDIQMPVVDGYEATRAIRERESRMSLPRLPVIAMTAYDREHEQERMTEAGCDAYLRKPVHKDELLTLVKRFAPAK